MPTHNFDLDLLSEVPLAEREAYINWLIGFADAVGTGVVESRSLQTPPPNVQEGDCYIIPPEGPEVGHWGNFWLNRFVFFFQGKWHSVTPPEGMKVWNKEIQQFEYFNGTSWGPLFTP